MSTPTPDQRRHAIAFNALTNSVAQTGRFVSLSEREQITRDVLAALDADQAVSDERYRAGLERADWLKTGEAADLIWALVHDYMAPGDIARRLHERITGEAGAVSVGDPAPAEPAACPDCHGNGYVEVATSCRGCCELPGWEHLPECGIEPCPRDCPTPLERATAASLPTTDTPKEGR